MSLADFSIKPSDSDREEVAILVHLCPDQITLMSVSVTWSVPAPNKPTAWSSCSSRMDGRLAGYFGTSQLVFWWARIQRDFIRCRRQGASDGGNPYF